MREFFDGHTGQGRVFTAVFRVTGSASHRVGGQQRAVQRNRVLKLIRQILVTALAKLIHRRRIPGSRVAPCAIIANFGVRLHPANRVTLVVVQRPSRKHHTPIQKRRRQHSQHGRKRKNNRKWGQTA